MRRKLQHLFRYLAFTRNALIFLSFSDSYESRIKLYNVRSKHFFFKNPAADAKDALQAWGLLCNSVMKMSSFFRFSV
jgi:hypothetical protein